MYLCSRMEEILDIKSMPTVQIIQALGKRFKEYRIAARMTQKEVAEQSGVSLLTIRRFEQGYSYDIKLGNLIALLKAIDFADGIADILPEFPASPYALARHNIKVTIWGKEVGRLTWDASRKRSIFEYAPNFLKGELDIAPLTASIYDRRNRLPFYGEANNAVFYGLPAFISDSLPGKWGDTVFSAWASANNLDEDHLTAVDKLSFIGKRGMGALEFEPSQEIGTGEMSLELDQLYRKAQEILEQREETVIAGKDITLESLYEVGTSAGGQHTKAVIARNNKTGEIRSGQIMLPSDYTYYLLKFAEKDYYPLTKVEMVYYRLATMEESL